MRWRSFSRRIRRGGVSGLARGMPGHYSKGPWKFQEEIAHKTERT